MIKFWFTILLLGFGHWGMAQFADDFSDGDFTNSPVWQGKNSHFQIDNSRLRLNAPAQKDSAHLVTPSQAIENASWQFDVEMQFNPSSANLTKVYLAADHPNLEQAPNALYVLIGNTADEISLYTRVNGDNNKMIDGPDKMIDLANVIATIRVTNSTGQLQLYADVGQTGSEVFIGEAEWNIHFSSAYFGVSCIYTTTRSTKFFFDNFLVSGQVEQTPPTITSANALDLKTAHVVFSEAVNNNVGALSSYSISGTNPTSIDLLNDQEVQLNFPQNFANGFEQTLFIKDVQDIAGNTIEDTTVALLFYQPEEILPYDIVVNEVMFDPSPTVNLPDVEYLEIFNASQQPIHLDSIKVYNSNTQLGLPHAILLPDSFLVLCPPNLEDTLKIAGVPSVHGATNWVALSNNGDSISIISSTDVIDVLVYTPQMLQDADKENGGWSLERINPYKKCEDPGNFSASTNASGGTPGSINSIFEDESFEPFDIYEAYTRWDTTVFLSFTKAISKTSLHIDSFSVEGQKPIAVFWNGFKTNEVLLKMSGWAISGWNTEVEFRVANCSGETLEGSVFVVTPEAVLENDIVFNEIMANPSEELGLPEEEYLELYNASDKTLSLAGLTYVNGNSSIVLPHVFMMPKSHLILCEDKNVSTFESYGEVLGLSKWPTLTNAGDSLVLKTQHNEIIDRVVYNKSYYHDTEKDNGGYSIERINPNKICFDPFNWAASNDTLGGTPGGTNSIYSRAEEALTFSLIQHEFNDTVIILHFNQTLQFWSTDDFLANGFQNPDSVFLSTENSTGIHLLFKGGFTAGETINLSYDVNNCFGENLSGWISIDVSHTAKKGDLIITEIMADPVPAVDLPPSEYIELFNTSPHTINLKGLFINGKEITETRLLESQAYLVLLSSNNSGYETLYPNPLLVEGLSTTFLPNNGGTVEITNQAGATITRVDYSPDWHQSENAKNGGYALSLKSTHLNCYNFGKYWQTSLHESGGTPGAANNVSAPNFKTPQLSHLYYKKEMLSLEFNIPIDTSGINNAWNTPPNLVNINPQENIISYQASNLEELNFTFPIKNCNRADLQTEITFELSEPQLPNEASVLINEVLANPSGDLEEYVELFNTTNEVIWLANTTWSTSGIFEQDQYLDTLGKLLLPNSYLLLSKDTNGLFQHYSQSNPWAFYPAHYVPSLTNDEFELKLFNSQGEVINTLNYNSDMHHPALVSEKGAALERISPTVTSDESENWVSASKEVNYGTPGAKNSQYLDYSSQADLSVDPPYFSPNNAGGDDATKITINTQQPGYAANIYVFNRQGNRIKTIGENVILGNENEFIWKGNTEDGSYTSPGIYLIWVEMFNGDGKNIKKKITVTVG